MHEISLKVINYIGLALGKEDGYFKIFFEKDPMNTLRTIYYPPRSHGVVDSSELDAASIKLTTPEHVDSGFVTLLTTFGYPGLQVLIDGEYRSIKPVKGALVLNLGATFERITNWKLKGTFHRVLDIGVERYSSPFFAEPRYSSIIPSNLLEPDDQ